MIFYRDTAVCTIWPPCQGTFNAHRCSKRSRLYKVLCITQGTRWLLQHMYPNSPELPGPGLGPAELSQLENRISPAKRLHTGSPRTHQCKLRGLQLTAGWAQPVRRAGRATTAAQVSADPGLKAKLALSPPPNSGSFCPSAEGSSWSRLPMSCFPILPAAKLAALSFSTKAQLALGVFFVNMKADFIPSLLQEAFGKSSWLPWCWGWLPKPLSHFLPFAAPLHLCTETYGKGGWDRQGVGRTGRFVLELWAGLPNTLINFSSFSRLLLLFPSELSKYLTARMVSFRSVSLHLLNLHLQERLHCMRPGTHLAQYSAAAGGQMLEDECKNSMGT